MKKFPRLNRKPFIWLSILVTIVSVLIEIPDFGSQFINKIDIMTTAILGGLMASRLKDMNKSPYLALIYFVPALIGDVLPESSIDPDTSNLLNVLLGVIIVVTLAFNIILMFLKSVDTDLENHTNKYGKNPLFNKE